MNTIQATLSALAGSAPCASAICVLSQSTDSANQQVISYLEDGEIRKVPVPQEWGPIRIGVSRQLDAALVSSLCLKQRASALSQDIAMAFAE